MTTTAEIIKKIGARELASRLGVQATAVHNAKDKGRFPARYYRVIAEIERNSGGDPVRADFLDLFSFAPAERAGIRGTGMSHAPATNGD